LAKMRKVVIGMPDILLEEVDVILAAVNSSRSKFFREAVALYMAEWRRTLRLEEMRRGYQEMAPINLALAHEQATWEAEATEVRELALAGVE